MVALLPILLEIRALVQRSQSYKFGLGPRIGLRTIIHKLSEDDSENKEFKKTIVALNLQISLKKLT